MGRRSQSSWGGGVRPHGEEESELMGRRRSQSSGEESELRGGGVRPHGKEEESELRGGVRPHGEDESELRGGGGVRPHGY